MITTRDWENLWTKSLDSCKRLGGNSSELTLLQPALEKEVKQVEDVIGLTLPASLRELFLGYSREISFNWFLPRDLKVPDFRGIFCGGLEISLESLPRLAERHRGWVEECFDRTDDPYDLVWHNKLSFQAVGNGDELAIDLMYEDGPVVYLSHDDGEGHGYHLGANFTEFIDRWTRLGCVGAEDWQWLHFTSSPTSYLQPDGFRGLKWRSWFGLP